MLKGCYCVRCKHLQWSFPEMLAGKITPISAELGYEPYIATEFPNTFPPLIFTN